MYEQFEQIEMVELRHTSRYDTLNVQLAKINNKKQSLNGENHVPLIK